MAGKVRLGTLRFQRPIRGLTAGPGTTPNNVGPQGGLGPKVIIRPGPRPGLYWYDTDDFVPFVASNSFDDDPRILGPAGQFPPSQPAIFNDGDDWIASIRVDEDYWHVKQGAPYVNGQAVTSDEDVYPQQVAPSIKVDEDYWSVNPGYQYVNARAFISDDDTAPLANAIGEDYLVFWSYGPYQPPQSAITNDGDDWVPSGVTPRYDEDYWLVNAGYQYTYSKALSADEDVLAFSTQIDEVYEWRSAYGPYSFAKAIYADEDVWVPSIPVDEDLPALPQVQAQWKQGFAVTADDEWVPAATAPIAEEDYWLIGRQTPYAYGQALIADDEWVPPPPTTAIDDDYWLINRQAQYVTPLQAYAFEEDWVVPPVAFFLDEDGLFIPRAAGQYAFGQPFNSDDDAWVPNVAPPNLHRLVMDINTGRLGWIVSGTHTGSPILIQLLD